MNLDTVSRHTLCVAMLGVFLSPAYTQAGIPAALDKARLSVGRACDYILGKQEASPETQKLIKELCEKLNIKREVPAHNMNLFVHLLGRCILRNMGLPNADGGYENTFSFLPGILDRIYVNEEWLKELSDEEKKFLLGRELVSIQHKDTLRKLIGDVAYTTACDIGELGNGSQSRSAKQICSSIFLKLLHNAYYRHIERQADCAAAQKLNCAEGGISLYANMREFKIKDPLYRSIPALFNRIFYPIASLPIIRLFLPFPTYEQRIKYLSQLDQQPQQN